ncbi:unnamed protein product [Prunus armeniaca]
MKTIFKSHRLWELVEKGIECSDSKGAGESDAKKKEKEESSGAGKMTVTELLMKDAKALGLIQGAVFDEIFPRISHEETSKGAWDILMKEFHGDKQDLDEIEVQEVVASLKSFELRLDRHSRDKTEKNTMEVKVVLRIKRIGRQKAKNGIINHLMELETLANIVTNYTLKLAQQLNYATQTESTPTMFYASNKGSASIKGCDDVWYLDSGCSNHMTGREDVLVDVDKNITAKLAMGTGQLVDVVGKGNLVVDTKMGIRYVKEVLLVVGLKENLLSVGQMMEHGYVLIFGANKAEIYDDSSLSNLVTKVQMKGNRSFPLKFHTTLQVALRANVESFLIWHRRMGHLNFTSLKVLQDQGMAVTKAGNRYFLTFIDDCTCMCWIYFLRYKSEVLNGFKKFKATVELQSGYKLKKIRSDGGGEYTFNEFNKFCEDMGMERQLTVSYSPQQNGVAERKSRTIMEMAKCMMIKKKMPLEFWAEVVNTAVYVQNRCPTKALDKKTPFEAYSGRNPGVKHLRVFGSLCYAHVPNQQRQKLDLASTRCIFLGDVIFNEATGWDWNARKECDISIPLNETLIEREEEPSDSSLSQEEISEEGHVDPDSGSQDVDHTPLKYKSIAEVYARCNLCIIKPETFEEAIKDEAWQKAMENEIEMIKKNKTWELVDRPTDKPVIGVKWVYKTKLNLDAPVARLDTIRTLVALAAKKGWKLFQLDVKSAFLNGVLHEEVYVDQPPSFIIKNKEDKVYRLKKALYGLKQAPRAWYEEINSYFTKADDIIYTRSSKALMMEFKTEMMRQYEMTDLGLLHHFLGLGVIQTEYYIFLHQKKYAKTLLDKFGFKDCKAVATPFAMNGKLSTEDGSEQADEGVYRQIVGSLLYLTATRPDIMFATSLLARFMHGPTRKHMGTAKKVLRYIQGTFDYGITYEKGKEARLIGYCDSDWSGSEDDMRSTSGYALNLGLGVFSWASVMQSSVALSIVEADYVSAAEATVQAIWLSFVLSGFGEEQVGATTILCDNTSAIAITKNLVHHHKTRHINKRFHFIRDAWQNGEIDLLYCKTEEQIADIFTKALARDRFEYLRRKLGLISAKHLEGSVEI